MAEILLVNEVAKARVTAAAGGGGATQFSGDNFVAAAAVFPAHTVGNNIYTAGPAFWSEHGGGQFAVTNAPWQSTSTSQAWHGIRPFSVNQTTGAISVGSYNSYSITGSMSWFYGNCAIASASSTVVRWDTGIESGQWRGFMRQFNVSGNSVSQSGTYVTSGSQPVWSNTMIPVFNGSTFVWNHGGYRDDNGSAWDMRWTGIGASVQSFLSTNSGLPSGTNTSTQNISHIITNFGATHRGASSIGTLRFYQSNSNNQPMVSVMNSNGDNVNNLAQGSVFGSNIGPNTTAVGLDLSNGTQLYYTNVGSILLRNGSSLSDVTTQADWIPGIHNFQNSSQPTRSYMPVATNKWMFVTQDTPTEVIVFSVNPTTYKVNIQATALVTTGLGNSNIQGNVVSNNGVFITGNTNQFLVFCAGEQDRYEVIVTKNPLAGVV